jgi:leucyl/phenylalanyl-tRNA--protein transferase
LHELGWVHSVEAWTVDDQDGHGGRLAGGLYGVAVGGLFAGESMFHRRTDASKAALAGLVDLLREGGVAGRVLDVQWMTPHLASLGAVDVPRDEYVRRVAAAVELPLPPAFTGAG